MAKGYVYCTSPYGEYEIAFVCPWCIADGSASEKLGACVWPNRSVKLRATSQALPFLHASVVQMSAKSLNRVLPDRTSLSAWAMLGLLIPICALAFDAEVFEAEVEHRARAYDAIARQDAVAGRLTAGDLDGFHARLISSVPDADKSLYDYFVLGNLLFAEAREQSYEYMRKAESLEPNNPFVIYERGIHEHRQGNCVAAIDYYRRLHEHYPEFSNPVSWAYRTHCALRTGQLEEAANAWRQADFGRHHTAIEKGMYAIFSESRPQSTRQSLISRIEAGEHQALCDLLHLDRNWEVDWWNRATKIDYLDADLARAEEILAAGTPARHEIQLCIDSPELSDSEFLVALTNGGFWGEDAVLPASGALIHELALRLTSNHTATPEQILERFGEDMWQRFVAGDVEQKFLEVLGFLYSATGDAARLRSVDEYGWRQLKLERFAASYILGADPTSPEYARLLDEALVDFPNSVMLNKLEMARVAHGPDRERVILAYVASEFANVKENWKGPYRLHDFMASLEHELGND